MMKKIKANNNNIYKNKNINNENYNNNVFKVKKVVN